MTIPALFFYLAHLQALRAIVFTVWAGMAMPPTKDSDAIADAIVTATLMDHENAVFGPEKTIAAMAYYSGAESNNHIDAYSNLDAPAWGFLQQQSGLGKGDALTQARGWLRLLAFGSRICPASPAAPLSGGCRRAYRLADRRTHTAWRLANLDF